MNITIKLLKIVMLMTYVRKKGMTRGIVLVVIGAIIAAFSGWWWYVVGLQAPGWVGLSPFYTIAGVVLFIIGLGLLLDYYYKAREEKPSKPSKPSRWKQAEPIT